MHRSVWLLAPLVAALVVAGCAVAVPAEQPVDVIEWSIGSASGTRQVLVEGTLLDNHRITWPMVQLPFHMTTTAPRGSTTSLLLSVSVYADDTATCQIRVNGAVVASGSTGSYTTPALCRWGLRP